MKVAFPNCLLIKMLKTETGQLGISKPVFIREFEELEVHRTWNFNFENPMIENVSKFYEKDPNNGNLRLLLRLPITQFLILCTN